MNGHKLNTTYCRTWILFVGILKSIDTYHVFGGILIHYKLIQNHYITLLDQIRLGSCDTSTSLCVRRRHGLRPLP